ncbi:MAG: shikimate kinase [Bacteroidetes bacterium]|nr:shikimate kinase [Bacteroidota bacterium]
MFSGKSTVGKKLASIMNYQFIDTDRYFEEKYKISILDFFEKFGEEMFRKFEHDILKELVVKDNVIISTGGGLPCYNNNIDLINDEGISIYLEMPFKAIINRQKNSKQKRPLLQNKTQEEIEEYLKALLTQREPIYKKSKITIDAKNVNFSDLKEVIENT